MSDLAKRLALNKYLPRHLAELSALLKREVRRGDLLTVEDTAALLARAKGTPRAPGWSCEMPFSDKNQPRFRSLVAALGQASAGGVYVWTPLGARCGIPHRVPLADVGFEFAFDLNPEGIVEFLSETLENRMQLEYWRDEEEKEMLNVAVDGVLWRCVRY